MITKSSESFVENFMKYVKTKDPLQAKFHQAVKEVIESLADFILQNPIYIHAKYSRNVCEIRKGTQRIY